METCHPVSIIQETLFILNEIWFPDKPRIVFQFELDGNVMDVYECANYLQIQHLCALCAKMLADYLEQVPDIPNIPEDMMLRIINYATPLQLLHLESRIDFQRLNIGKTNFHHFNISPAFLLPQIPPFVGDRFYPMTTSSSTPSEPKTQN